MLNQCNQFIRETGAEVPSHSIGSADWDPDGYLDVELYTTHKDYELMQPAFDRIKALLREHNWLRSDTFGEYKHEQGVTFTMHLQRVNITVRDHKGARLRVLTYDEYSNRLYAAKLKGEDKVLRIWIRDHEREMAEDRYEWFFCLQPYDLEEIQSILDKKLGEGKYLAVETANYPRDRRKKPTFQNSVYERDGMEIMFQPAYGHYELCCKEGTPTISNEECERLKKLGVKMRKE